MNLFSSAFDLIREVIEEDPDVQFSKMAKKQEKFNKELEETHKMLQKFNEDIEKQLAETEEEDEEAMKEETMTTEEILKDNKKYAGYDNPLWGYDLSGYIVREKADENGMCNFYSTTYIGGNKKVDLKNPSVSLPYTEALEISKYDYPAQEFSKRRFDEVRKRVYVAINTMSDDDED